MTEEAVMQRAIQSWARRHSGTWQPADEAELQAWIAAAPQHREAYEKVASAWDAAGELRGSLRVEQGARYHGLARPGGRRPRSSRRGVALAAGIVLLTVAGTAPFWSASLRRWNGSDVHLVTLKGRSKPFVLDDGTRVLLDGDSELIARLGPNRRKVTLIRGEAQFNVSHDASRPFEVTAGSGRVEDLGTDFDIEALTDSTRIGVLEGRVAVSTPHGRTLLVAGQAGGYDHDGNLDPVGSFDRTRVVGDLEGQRHFDHERLGDVLDRMARHHTITFRYQDSRLRDLRVSGTFKTGDVDLFLRTLAAALPIEPRYLAPHEIEIVSQSARGSRGSRSGGASSEPH